VKALVAYHSLTGKTAKVARAIFDALPQEKELAELGDLGGLEGYGVYFIGFPIHGNRPAKEASRFLEAHAEGRPVALFTTHATPEGSPDVTTILQNCTHAAAGARVLGIFNCQGELADEVMERLIKGNHPYGRLYAEQGNFTKGQPDASRLERAGAFARHIMERIG
jgi:flavodoxin